VPSRLLIGNRADRKSLFGGVSRWEGVYRISNDYFGGVVDAYRRVREHGYRRIGLAPFRHKFDIEDDAIRAAASHYCNLELSAKKDRIPVLRTPVEERNPFMDWFERHRPEAIISLHVDPYFWLCEAGLNIPEDCAFAALNRSNALDSIKHISGNQNLGPLLGRVTISALDSLIRAHAYGIPAHAQRTLVEYEWIEGTTLPHIK